MSVAIIDYGSGNLHSAAKAFERAARSMDDPEKIVVTRDPETVYRADRIVLPGVGAFADCRRGLDALDGMIEAMTEAVRSKARPFFGICVGMQLMATRGKEHVTTDGFNWIAGDVEKISPREENLKIPHMGWNTLDMIREHPVLERLPLGPKGRHAYFVHSYHLNAANEADVLARADYGGPVTAIVGKDTADRHPVSPGEEPAFRAGLDLEFSEMEAVILFPAIDLKNGQCVRLEQGDMARATVFNLDPAAQARSFAAQGFEYLHVVDLDGAFAGRPMNAHAVEAMLKAVTMPVQLGGGIRDLDTVEAWLDKRHCAGDYRHRGSARSRAGARPPRKNFPAASRSASTRATARSRSKAGPRPREVTALEIAQRFEDAGVAAIIFTDIARDGLLKGLNLDATIALAERISIPVIASGGLASIEDVKALAGAAREKTGRRDRGPRAL